MRCARRRRPSPNHLCRRRTRANILKRQFLENLLEKNNESNFFVGKKISIADLAIWRLLGWLTSGLLDGVPTDILEPYERLKKLREEVYNHPKVHEWMIKTYGKII